MNLNEHNLLDCLTPSLRQEILNYFMLVSYESGHRIVAQGAPGKILGIVDTGTLDVHRQDADGQSRMVDRLRAGDIVGEIALLSGEPSSATVIASSAATVWELPRADFERIVMSQPSAIHYLNRIMRGRLSRYRDGGLTQEAHGAAVLLEVSARHVHLSVEHLHALFGADAVLHNETELSQPGQYACAEKVTLVGPNGSLEHVRVLGPERKQTQVELSATDARLVGVQAPVRDSGNLAGSAPLTLEGPTGRVDLEEGTILALRHIHMTPQDALRFGLKDRDFVRVKVDGDRELVFGDVLVRVSPAFRLAMHIDTDEANASGLKNGQRVHFDSLQGTA